MKWDGNEEQALEGAKGRPGMMRRELPEIQWDEDIPEDRTRWQRLKAGRGVAVASGPA